MGDVIRKKIQRCYIVIIVIALLLLTYMTCFLWICADYQLDERYVRVELNHLLSELNQNGIEGQMNTVPQIEFPYTIFDNKGTIVWDTTGQYTDEKQIDLTTLGSASHYLVPIVHQGKEQGILEVDCSQYKTNKLKQQMPLFLFAPVILIICLIVIIIRQKRYFNCDIWNPIKELHTSIRKILAGNYEEKIGYDYDGEIGTLCHDFEKMRDDLRDSHLREMQAREAERVVYASISHDLRTPLAIVKGYLEAVFYDVLVSQDEIKTSVEHCLTKINGISRMTDDILEHSKAQLGQLSIEMQEVYADEYFGKLLDEYEQDALHQGYELTYNLPARVLLRLDTNRIAEVMLNLISNAVKYSGDHLRLNISFEIVSEDQRILIVNVKDNGCGINAVDLPFIFDLFYRGNKARTQDIPGSGLGLNISRYIVEQHGGRIECDSIVGVGTTISFSIPIV